MTTMTLDPVEAVAPALPATRTAAAAVPAAPAPTERDIAWAREIIAAVGPDEQADARSSTRSRLTEGAVWGALGIGAITIAAGGMISSFHTVQLKLTPAFGDFAFIPAGALDLAVFVFAGIDLQYARRDMSTTFTRLGPRVLTAASIALNATAGGGMAGSIAHIAMPALWAYFVEITRHAVRKQVLEQKPASRKGIPGVRWIFDPVRTFKLRRRMALWDQPSYPAALATERRRLAAIAKARRVHGPFWRFKIGPDTRLALSLGELGPEDIAPTLAPAGTAAHGTVTVPEDAGTAGVPAPESDARDSEQRPAPGTDDARDRAAAARRDTSPGGTRDVPARRRAAGRVAGQQSRPAADGGAVNAPTTEQEREAVLSLAKHRTVSARSVRDHLEIPVSKHRAAVLASRFTTGEIA